MPLTRVYDNSFASASSETGWIECRNAGNGVTTTLQRVTNDGAPYVKAVSTESNSWWWDPNHYYPGLGYVNLLAVAYAQGYTNGVLPSLNYSNGSVILTLRAKNLLLPRAARMIWWMQSAKGDGKTYYNYGQVANPIDEQLGFGSKGWFGKSTMNGVADSGWVDVTIPLPSANSAWRCYGSSPSRSGVPPLGNPDASVIYGCAPGGGVEALNSPLVDMGIHLVWDNTLVGSPRGSKPPPIRAYGELHLRRVQLYANT